MDEPAQPVADRGAEHAIRFDRAKGLDHLLGSLTTTGCLDRGSASYLALRMGEPDALPVNDLRLRRALSDDPDRPLAPEATVSMAEPWQPWRAHAAAQLW